MKKEIDSTYLSENVELRKKLRKVLPRFWRISYIGDIGVAIDYYFLFFPIKRGGWVYYHSHDSKIVVEDRKLWGILNKFGEDNGYKTIVKKFPCLRG